MRRGDRDRAKQERGRAASVHMPEANRADEAVAIHRDKRQTTRGRAALAQALAGLAAAAGAEGGVEQSLARGDIGRALVADHDRGGVGQGMVVRHQGHRCLHRARQSSRHRSRGADRNKGEQRLAVRGTAANRNVR